MVAVRIVVFFACFVGVGVAVVVDVAAAVVDVVDAVDYDVVAGRSFLGVGCCLLVRS